MGRLDDASGHGTFPMLTLPTTSPFSSSPLLASTKATWRSQLFLCPALRISHSDGLVGTSAPESIIFDCVRLLGTRKAYIYSFPCTNTPTCEVDSFISNPWGIFHIDCENLGSHSSTSTLWRQEVVAVVPICHDCSPSRCCHCLYCRVESTVQASVRSLETCPRRMLGSSNRIVHY